MLCWARTLFIFVVVVLGALSMLNACGQKGDLYLPDEPPAAPVPQGQDVPAVPTPPANADSAAQPPS